MTPQRYRIRSECAACARRNRTCRPGCGSDCADFQPDQSATAEMCPVDCMSCRSRYACRHEAEHERRRDTTLRTEGRRARMRASCVTCRNRRRTCYLSVDGSLCPDFAAPARRRTR